MPNKSADPPPGEHDFLRAGRAAPSRTLIEIFNDTVAKCPEAVALDSGAQQLSYVELAEAADQLAADLQVLGVGRGDRVGVSRVTSGTTTLYVAVLGILTAGAA